MLKALSALLPLAATVLAPLGAQTPAPQLRLFGGMASGDTHLVDTNGAFVHTWRTPHPPGLGVYLLDDGTLLRTIATKFLPAVYGGAGGGIQRLALDGTVLWDFRYDTEQGFAHHDIAPMPNGNVLMIAWEDKDGADAVAAGRNPFWISNALFRPDHVIEVQPTGPTSGAIVWQWHAWDHLIQDFDPTKANFGVVQDHPELLDINYPPGGFSTDWNHCNGIDYDPVNDWVVISSRFQSEVWILDHSTTTAEAAGHTGGNHGKGGDLLYRWGNPAAYRRGSPSSQTLFGQHGVQMIPQGYPGAGNLLLFNNGKPGGSAAEELVLPLDAQGRFVLAPGGTYGPTAPVWSHQGGFFSTITSSARRARNGNTLICSGQQGLVLEVDPAGNTVWTSSLFGPIFHAHYVDHYLFADRTSVSALAGGQVQLDLIAGSEHAGRPYLVLGSASGTAPGVTLGGQLLPLNPDGYFDTIVAAANTPPFGNTFGVLDALGRARATVTLPPGLPALQGLHLDHAFVAVDPAALAVTRASNAVPLDVVR